MTVISESSISAPSMPEHLEELDVTDQSNDLQLWSALTLGSLQKNITGKEKDPRYAKAIILIDGLAKKFASSDPVSIADYFEAVQALERASVDSNNEES